MEYTVNYSDFEAFQGNALRRILRGTALDCLSIRDGLLDRQSTILKTPRIQFLYFHHVFLDEVENVKKILSTLSQHHRFISYSDAVDKLLNGKIDQPYICFSSDDGFKNNLNALQAFEDFGISCCYFINPTTIAMTAPDQIKGFCQSRLSSPPIEFMNWEDISNLQKKGHEIGSHTMNHIKLSETNANEIEEELMTSYEEIKKRCGAPTHFAYPYGRFNHFNPVAKEMIYNIGYSSCASAERGCHFNANQVIPKEELLIRRDQVIFAWKESHIKYFLRKNATIMTPENNFYSVAK